jgi:hypothetical protein
MESERVNCLRCRHYQVTWVPATPRGCQAHGFRSAEMPSQVVQRSSGMPCQLFSPRPAGAPEEPKRDQ